MEIKICTAFVIALSLCELAMSSDVANAFLTNEVVPDVVDIAPLEEIKVINVK